MTTQLEHDICRDSGCFNIWIISIQMNTIWFALHANTVSAQIRVQQGTILIPHTHNHFLNLLYATYKTIPI